jgi:uncharacterized protein YdaU (DUF1376 family)
MAKPQWFKFYGAQFLLDGDVADLSLEAQAILVRMWCLGSLEGRIPSDPNKLAIRIGVDANAMQMLMQKLYTFFLQEDEHLISERQKSELEKFEQVSEKRSSAAKSMWNKKRGNSCTANADANAQASADASVKEEKRREEN